MAPAKSIRVETTPGLPAEDNTAGLETGGAKPQSPHRGALEPTSQSSRDKQHRRGDSISTLQLTQKGL